MQDSIKALLKDFLFASANGQAKEGLSQAEHTAFMVKALVEAVPALTELTADDQKAMFATLYDISNGSALRQKAEKYWPAIAGKDITKDNFMKQSDKKKGADASALANKWF